MFQVIFIIAFSFIAFLFCLELWLRTRKFYQLAKFLPGPKLYPIIGATEFLFLDQEGVYKARQLAAKKYGNDYAVYMAGKLSYFSTNPDVVEAIATDPINLEKATFYDFLHGTIGRGLFTSFGETWKTRRRMITPTFHFNVLKSFLPAFQENTRRLVNNIRKDQLNCENGTNLDALISEYVLRMMAETAFGVALDEGVLHRFRFLIYVIGQLIVERMVSPWLRSKFLCKLLNKTGAEENREFRVIVNRIIAQRRSLIDMRNSSDDKVDESIYFNRRRIALLDTLLEAEKNHEIDTRGIYDEVATFLTAGYDTTKTAIMYLLFVIAQYPDIQDKVYDEVSTIYGSNRERSLDKSELNEMKYLDLVIKETLRMYPPAWIFGRRLQVDKLINGIKFPAGSNINIFTRDLHMNETYFPEPQHFMPERFLPENCEKRHKFCYIPFMAGSRNCIGQKYALMEIKVAISTLILNFRLEAVTRTEDLIFIQDMLLRTKFPLYVRFVERKS